MQTKFRLAAITDEFSPNLETALQGMCAAGLQGAELRMISGRNIVDLTDDEVDRAVAMVRERGMEIMSIASPLLKCGLPGGPEVEARFQQDMFAAKYGFEDQPRLAARTFEIAERTGASIIRVFSYWRTVQPEACFGPIVEALDGLTAEAGRRNLIIGIENEHACNISTGAETAAVLSALDRPNLKVVWDPANALVAGEAPFPEGYGKIPPERIAHVHAKDCRIENGQPVWGPVGECEVDWRGQVAALARDGYSGWISLETHWAGPAGDKFEASSICARLLRRLTVA
jgi:sugar phosphate isomerase/epimerase